MNWLKLGIPVLLGLLAGWIYYSSATKTVESAEFTRLIENIKAGDTFDDSQLEKVELRGDVEALRNSAVLYAERKVLFNKSAQYSLKKGDLVFFRDITPPSPDLPLQPDEAALPVSLEGVGLPPQLIRVGDQIEFIVGKPAAPPRTAPGKGTALPSPVEESPLELEVIGPFRVVSVGTLTYRTAGDESTSRTSQANSLTVAIKRQGSRIEDRNVLELIRASQEERGSQRRLLKVLLLPTRRPQPTVAPPQKT